MWPPLGNASAELIPSGRVAPDIAPRASKLPESADAQTQSRPRTCPGAVVMGATQPRRVRAGSAGASSAALRAVPAAAEAAPPAPEPPPKLSLSDPSPTRRATSPRDCSIVQKRLSFIREKGHHKVRMSARRELIGGR